MSSTDDTDPDGFDQYAALVAGMPAPPRLPAPERMDAAAARLRRVTALPAVRHTMPGPVLATLQQLAHALTTSAARHRLASTGPCDGTPCVPGQIADALLGDPIARHGHGDDDGAEGAR